MDRRITGPPSAVPGKEDDEEVVARLQEVHRLATPSPEHPEDLVFEETTHLIRSDEDTLSGVRDGVPLAVRRQGGEGGDEVATVERLVSGEECGPELFQGEVDPGRSRGQVAEMRRTIPGKRRAKRSSAVRWVALLGRKVDLSGLSGDIGCLVSRNAPRWRCEPVALRDKRQQLETGILARAMSEANVDRFIELVEVFNRLSEAGEEFNREPLRGFLGVMDPKIQFQPQQFALQGGYVGHEGVLQWLADLAEHYGKA
jgi:hypothetical protein